MSFCVMGVLSAIFGVCARMRMERLWELCLSFQLNTNRPIRARAQPEVTQSPENLIHPGTMHWIYLIIAILLEVSGTTCMKISDGFTKLAPTLFIFIFYGLSFTFLSLALKVLPIALTYAIWSGIGTATITVIGVIWFGEGLNAIKIISLLLIIIGVAGLHYGQQQLH